MEQDKKISMRAVVGLAIFILLGVFVFYSNKPEKKSLPPAENPAVVGTTFTVVEGATSSPAFSGKVLAGLTSPLLDFNKADYDKALSSGQPILIYFYANWCPICKSEIANALYPAFNSLTQSGLIGFRVNYKDGDTDVDETALARQFGIGYQHTKVLLKGGKVFFKSPPVEWDKVKYNEAFADLLKS